MSEIQFFSQGFYEILHSDGLRDFCQSVAEDIADRAGEGFGVKEFEGGFGGGRPIWDIRTESDKAAQAESDEKTLTKAVG